MPIVSLEDCVLLEDALQDMAPLSVNQISVAYNVTVPITRPSNTASYGVNDVVGGVLHFQNVGPAGGPIMITGTQLEIDISAIPSGMGGYRMHLYSASPPSAYADNDPWDLSTGDRSTYLGYVDLGAPSDLGLTLYVEQNNVNKQVKLSTADLYAYLVTLSAFQPGSGSVLKSTLHTMAV